MRTGEEQLRWIVREFRRGMIGRRQSKGRCWLVCAPLVTMLRMFGHEVQMTEGAIDQVPHFWLTLSDGRIVDPTADQFTRPDGGKMPAVYVGERPEWYREAE